MPLYAKNTIVQAARWFAAKVYIDLNTRTITVINSSTQQYLFNSTLQGMEFGFIGKTSALKSLSTQGLVFLEFPTTTDDTHQEIKNIAGAAATVAGVASGISGAGVAGLAYQNSLIAQHQQAIMGDPTFGKLRDLLISQGAIMTDKLNKSAQTIILIIAFSIAIPVTLLLLIL